MALTLLALASLVLAAGPMLLFMSNIRIYRSAPCLEREGMSIGRVSVLIPARDEENAIGPAVAAALASRGVEVEVVVLDDHSTDRTAAIVSGFAARDTRVRRVSGPDLPEGWCGKQHACSQLAEQARFPLLAFLDADVQLAPDGLAQTGGVP